MTDDAKCPHCHRPAWVRHGGMGGGLMPCHETHCIRPQGRDCRTAREGYKAAESEVREARAKLDRALVIVRRPAETGYVNECDLNELRHEIEEVLK